MDFYGITKETVAETNARNAAEKEKRLQNETKQADEKSAVNGVALRRAFGEPVFFIDGRASNLWVYPDKVILDRSDGGLTNLFNHTIKIIPIKYIQTLQIKNTGLWVGVLEFGVSGYDAAKREAVDLDNENRFMFAANENGQKAFDAYFYIADRIVK